MRKKRIFILTFFLVFNLLGRELIAQSIQAQIISTAGTQNSLSNNVSISSTVGESVVGSTLNGLNMHSGFQQGSQGALTGIIFKPTIESANIWNISPNPGYGKFEVKNATMHHDFSGAWIEIFDLRGRIIHRELLQGPVAVFDISNQDDGLYYLNVIENQTQTSLPFILLPH